jgi:hypothetical protein
MAAWHLFDRQPEALARDAPPDARTRAGASRQALNSHGSWLLLRVAGAASGGA